MELNLAQTKLVGLTMKLDLKSREYKMLSDKLTEYKNENIDANDERLYKLLEDFQKNNEEIVEIKKQLIELENIKEENKIENNEIYQNESLFKQRAEEKNNTVHLNNEDKIVEDNIVEYKGNFIERIKNMLKRIFKI